MILDSERPRFRFCNHWACPLTLLLFGLANQGLQAQEISNSWKFTVGIGAINQPKFPGSSESMTRVLPFVAIEYGRVFLGGAPGTGVPAGLGAYLYRDSVWTLGVGLGQDLTKPRRESDSPRLHGLGDIDSTPLGAVFASGRWPCPFPMRLLRRGIRSGLWAMPMSCRAVAGYPGERFIRTSQTTSIKGGHGIPMSNAPRCIGATSI